MRTETFGSAEVPNLSWPANLITAFAARLLPLLLLLILPGVVRGQYPPQFIYTITDDTATITLYQGPDGEVVIPGTLDGLPVTTIGGYVGRWGFWHGAFEGRSGVTGVTIPNSVTTIGSRAFNSCLSLTSVTIPNSVISIESGSFAYCYSLTNVTIPASVSSIGVGAFFESGLTAVYFRGNCPTPSDNLFQDASMAIVYYLPGTAGWAATLAGRPTAFWVLPYPLILTSSVGFGPQSNRFGFRISWSTNLSVVIETETGVLGSNWAPISTNALSNGWVDFSDDRVAELSEPLLPHSLAVKCRGLHRLHIHRCSCPETDTIHPSCPGSRIT